ncbi:MAG TPA: S8 family serine peptidase [Vitreimonas sp.]|uniref:S8 family serine peptidase n=1 Tax=Vitreimonas sp. TaxID=3069702 RepID=UPI002D2BF2E0|nr:S8 family serine peptidase [Vitreimonas sp.]HYD88986.1 S8 family serine peptidase [Vitreimonas sp.]
MSHRRWSLAALVLAPLLALGACDQIGKVFDRGDQQAGPGPVALNQVPLEARALAGAVQPQDQIAALLAPEPVLIAPGQVLIGARVEQELAESASEMGLASNFVRSLRAQGADALEQLPENMVEEVRARAEAEASEAARIAARDVLGRLGVDGEVQVRPGGVVTVSLAGAGASPTSLRYAQQAGEAAAQAPSAIEWNEADRCPRIVTQRQLETDIALATRCAIQRLQASRQFEYAEPNYIADPGFDWPPRRNPQQQQQQPGTQPPQQPRAPAPAQTPIGGAPNDPLYALQWHYRPRGTGEGQSAGGAGFLTFWEASQVGSREVRVAVLDTGVDLNHPDIVASGNVVSGVDMIANPERGGDNDGVDGDAQDAGDRCGAAAENSYHGTHVAGTIGAAATNDRVGVAGGAWNVTVIPVRVLGRCGGELADIVSGIRWAAGVAPALNAAGQQIVNRDPADIINMSLTIQAPCPASMQAAIDAAVANNVIVVVAAGNKANQTRLYAPANCNNVVVVGASDARGGLAFYSNFGPEVDLLAPGGDVFSDADGDGRPDGVLSTRATATGCYDPLNQNSTERCYYSFLQGTSMAAPHVSAALALLASQSGLRGRELEDALFRRAISGHGAEFGQIECARSRNATPLSTGATTCARPSGRGALDLALAARTIAPAAP